MGASESCTGTALDADRWLTENKSENYIIVKNKPLISVIIPAFNEEKNISACFTSLTNQKTDMLYEVILIDNNSSDKTGEIGKKFDVRVVREERQGRAFARQRGAIEAKGEILAFTEADCIVPSNYIETLGFYFDTHPEIIGLSGEYRLWDSTLFLTYLTPLGLHFGDFLYQLFVGNHSFRGVNFAIRINI
jgi:glycosyltransferase involved in cell wall biosynthesis